MDASLKSTTPEFPQPDLHLLTSSGLRIPAHTRVLASVSPVLESIIERPPKKQRESQWIIPILGVPSDAVSAFVGFLYSSRCTEEELEKFGIHLLALSHVYQVPHLKQKCTRAINQRLTIDNVVDVLQLARMCDAPDLYLKCMKLVDANFKSVEETEGWKFVQENDPWLELEILQFIDEAHSRKKKTKRRKEEHRLYLELNEAMECLQHICSEGCTIVGPYGMEPSKKKAPCAKFDTCHGIQLLISHFATCKKRVGGVCLPCKRTWQLFKLHSCLCDQPDSCKVPLCRPFKMKMKQEKNSENALWRLLVKKVVAAKTMSSLTLPKRKRDEDFQEPTMEDSGIRSFAL